MPAQEKKKRKEKKERKPTPAQKKKKKKKFKRWSKVAAVGPLCVFNYNIAIAIP